MKRYGECHLFLDESGDLAQERKSHERLVVGGLLVCGRYDQQADADLQARIREVVEGLGGRFPQDLHSRGDNAGGNGGLDRSQREELARKLTRVVADWSESDFHVFGVACVHHQDILTGTDALFAEASRDNRYLRMVFTLIEHLFLVQGDCLEQALLERPRIHLCPANRKFVFSDNQSIRKQSDRMGERTEEFRRRPTPGRDEAVSPLQYCVQSSLTPQALQTALKSLVWYRWPDPGIQIEEIRVESIPYRKKDTDQNMRGGSTKRVPEAQRPACLWLSDIYLDGLKSAFHGGRRAFIPPREWSKTPVAPTVLLLQYGPALDLLAEMAAAIHCNRADSYAEARASFDEYLHNCASAGVPDNPSYGVLSNKLELKASEKLQMAPQRWLERLEKACRVVDLPGTRQAGLDEARRAFRHLVGTECDGARVRALLLQAELSSANHQGLNCEADKLWSQFLQLRDSLASLGMEGLRLEVEIINRFSVALTDQLRFQDAADVLAGLIEDYDVQDRRRKRDPDLAVGRNYELGACCGSLGQALAFLGRTSEAIQAFRKAIILFADRDDVHRQWNYLGHVACDLGREHGGDLWRETARHVELRLEDEPLLDSAARFDLALQVKALLVFGDDDQIVKFTDRWIGLFASPAEAEGVLDGHPYGLVRQDIGLLMIRRADVTNQAVWRGTGCSWLDAAATALITMAKAEGEGQSKILTLLGAAAKLRMALARATQTPEKLDAYFTLFRGYAQEFGEYAWSSSALPKEAGIFGSVDPGEGKPVAERAKAVLGALRLQYW